MTTRIHNSCTATPITHPRTRSVRGFLVRAYGVWSSRRALSRLTGTQLEDVGLTPAEADREARRPVWDVPANWRD